MSHLGGRILFVLPSWYHVNRKSSRVFLIELLVLKKSLSHDSIDFLEVLEDGHSRLSMNAFHILFEVIVTVDLRTGSSVLVECFVRGRRTSFENIIYTVNTLDHCFLIARRGPTIHKGSLTSELRLVSSRLNPLIVIKRLRLLMRFYHAIGFHHLGEGEFAREVFVL